MFNAWYYDYYNNESASSPNPVKLNYPRIRLKLNLMYFNTRKICTILLRME